MVSGILNCGKTLLWSIILLTLLSYIYGVFCLQLASDWLATFNGDRALDQATQESVGTIRDNFPSMPWAIYTLFKAVVGGIDWGPLSDQLGNISSMLLISFLLYMFITVLCVLNVVTAAFVDASTRSSQDDDVVAWERMRARSRWIKEVRRLFARHDADGDGFLNLTECKTFVYDWRSQVYFSRMEFDLDYQDLEKTFRLFDVDCRGKIDVNDFARWVQCLRGSARSLDMFRQFSTLDRKMDRALARLDRLEKAGRLSNESSDCPMTAEQ